MLYRNQRRFFSSYLIKGVLGVLETEKQVEILVHVLLKTDSLQKPSYNTEHKHNLPTLLFHLTSICSAGLEWEKRIKKSA